MDRRAGRRSEAGLAGRELSEGVPAGTWDGRSFFSISEASQTNFIIRSEAYLQAAKRQARLRPGIVAGRAPSIATSSYLHRLN